MNKLKNSINTPNLRLLGALVFMSSCTAAVIWMALAQPRTGIAFDVGGVLRSAQGQTFEIEALDLTPEPGEITADADLDRFYQRQGELESLLSSEGTIYEQDGLELAITKIPFTISDLMAIFWIQIAVGVGAFAISVWVWALRPRDLATSLFALSGVSTLLFTFSAALYTTRELALPIGLFKSLTALNCFGASLFGVCVVGLFLVYPVRLKFWKPILITQAVIFMAWAGLAIVRATPASFAVNFITMIEMLGILLAIIVQFFATSRSPQARAALIWLGLAVLVGAGAFILLNAVPLVFDREVAIEQGYAFLFFLVIYIGLAAGLRRYKLFEVGQWAFRILFYAVGALVLIALDIFLVSTLDVSRVPALSVSLLVLTLAYLPLRDYIWQFVGKRQKVKTQDLLAEAMHVALASSSSARSERWQVLIKKLFDPLKIEVHPQTVTDVEIAEDGLQLLIPSVANTPCLRISYPWAGKALFDMESVQLAAQVIILVKQAETNREAYDRGVIEERRRMARDLHDDVGARLMTGITLADDKLRPNLQAALDDIRSIVSGISEENVILQNLLAEVRHETARRVESAGIVLHWPVSSSQTFDPQLSYRQHKAIRSALREIVSNVIRHARANQLKVKVEVGENKMNIIIEDDGCGIPEAILSAGGSGNGLKNLQYRLRDIQGSIEIVRLTQGTRIDLVVPYGPQ